MFVKVEEHILLAKLRAILRKEEEKPEEERDQEFIALAYETMAHLERQRRDRKSDSKRPAVGSKEQLSGGDEQVHRRRLSD
jgi:hypothetical protein